MRDEDDLAYVIRGGIGEVPELYAYEDYPEQQRAQYRIDYAQAEQNAWDEVREMQARQEARARVRVVPRFEDQRTATPNAPHVNAGPPTNTLFNLGQPDPGPLPPNFNM